MAICDVIVFPPATADAVWITDESCYFGHGDSESMVSGANDVVVVRQSGGDDLEPVFKATQLNVRVGKFANLKTFFRSREGKLAKIFVNNRRLRTSGGVEAHIADSGAVIFKRRDHACMFTTNELRAMNLALGRNDGLVVVPELDVEIPFNIHLLLQGHKLILTDIDGTITTSDVSGFILPQVGMDAHHSHVIEFLQRVSANGYVPVYLTARPMSLSQKTREYLFQNSMGSVSVPKGPLFVSPKVTSQAVLAPGSQHEDKTKAIRSLANLFDERQDAIVGAYGNKNSDVEAYMDAGIRPDRIYLINEDSVIRNAKTGRKTSYGELVANIDALYPRQGPTNRRRTN